MQSNIRNSLWMHRLGRLQEMGNGNQVPIPLRKEGAVVCVHKHIHTHALSHTICWKEPGFHQDPKRNSFSTQISWLSLYPTEAGTCSAWKDWEKLWAEQKGWQTILSAFNRSLRLLTAALARWTEGQRQASGNKNPLTSIQVSTSRDAEEAQGLSALSFPGLALKPKYVGTGVCWAVLNWVSPRAACVLWERQKNHHFRIIKYKTQQSHPIKMMHLDLRTPGKVATLCKYCRMSRGAIRSAW